jgi:hypothetical protein
MDVGEILMLVGHASAANDERLLGHSALCRYLFSCSLVPLARIAIRAYVVGWLVVLGDPFAAILSLYSTCRCHNRPVISTNSIEDGLGYTDIRVLV